MDEEHNIITLGTDSKLVRRIFELKCNSLLKEIETENPGYELKKPDTQTEYLDFYYVCPDEKRISGTHLAHLTRLFKIERKILVKSKKITRFIMRLDCS